MSIPVALADIGQVLQRFRFAYLLTAGAQGAPRAVAIVPRLEDGALVIDNVGRRTRQNAAARPTVGLVWPPMDVAEYSLVVDGTAVVAGDGLRITPTSAVLHRPAVAAPGTA